MRVILVFAAASWLAISPASAAPSNIDPANPFGWSENAGWLDFRDAGEGEAGVRVMPTILTGYVWSENLGWISVGDGTPADGLHYANSEGSDWGVNVDPATGDLFGLAWGENIGWVNCDTRSALGSHGQQARVDYMESRLRGYLWSENTGWINLDDGSHYVAYAWPTCPLLFADADTDGDVDLDDFARFQRCHTGSNGGLLEECECWNRAEPGFPHGDNDVDMVDLDRFNSCRSAPAVPADPDCGNE